MAYPPPVFLPQRNVKHPIQEKHIRHKMTSSSANVARQKLVINNTENEKNKINSCHEVKSPVYIHQFCKLPNKQPNNCKKSNLKCGSEIHQNLYKHEYSEYYDAKTINQKHLTIKSCPSRIPKATNLQQNMRFPITERIDYYNQGSSKIPLSKLNHMSKMNKALIFKPEYKLMADKLEESYWAKWKPSKVPIIKQKPKVKGLYTENEKIKIFQQVINKNGKNERGDSNEALNNVPITLKLDASLRKITSPVHNSCSFLETHKPEDSSQDKNNQKMNSDTKIVNLPETISDYHINALKHTDSFILTSKKKSQEKSHYQQPKCIKLFKNSGYCTSGSTNYIKGGTYPLKSCLKKESITKSQPLGRPGGPIVATNRKPGKANRFTT